MVESRRKKEETFGKDTDVANQDPEWGARLLEGQERQTKARLSSFGAIIDARYRLSALYSVTSSENCAPPKLNKLPTKY